jgi:hypothetical protein
MMRDRKTKSAIPARPRIKHSASLRHHHCSLIQDNGEHDDADNDKYGDILSPRHSDHGGLGKFDEDEEFDDNEYRKISSAQTLSKTKRAMVANVSASRLYTKRCVSVIIMLFNQRSYLSLNAGFS